MKINKELVQERLAGIPEEKRSHIYNATLVLEFLTATFMPTAFFLPVNFKVQPGIPLGEKSMRAIAKDKAISISDLYDIYLLFREERDYTAPIESKYIFSIIVRNLRFYKNGWEFIPWRVGVAQIWYIGPLILRTNVPDDVRKNFASKLLNKSISATTVEADPVSVPEEDPLDRFVEAVGAERFVEARGDDRFVEAYGIPGNF